MGKIEKKKQKLQERIENLEKELRESLTKKTHDSAEIDVPKQMTRIKEAREALARVK